MKLFINCCRPYRICYWTMIMKAEQYILLYTVGESTLVYHFLLVAYKTAYSAALQPEKKEKLQTKHPQHQGSKQKISEALRQACKKPRPSLEEVNHKDSSDTKKKLLDEK